MSESGSDRSRRRGALGLMLIGLGILVVLGGAEYVLWSVDGRMRSDFADRPTYDETKQKLHESFPIGFAIALVGLGIAGVGARVRMRARGE